MIDTLVRNPIKLVLGIIIALVLFLCSLTCIETVEGGHKGVAITFGNISDQELSEGFHFKAPWTTVIAVDCKNQAESDSFKSVSLKAQDQLTSNIDVTVNWRVDGAYAAEAYRETGGLEGLRDKYLVPTTRSLIREIGKSVNRSEDFFNSEVQVSMQSEILTKLKTALSEKGIIVEAVLFRNIMLPPSIEKGINAKKEREQEAERAEATLLKFQTDQKQLNAQAKAQLEAARTNKEKAKVNADALAYSITSKAAANAKAAELDIIARAKANAENVRLKGEAQAKIIELQGIARAKAIRAESEALAQNANIIKLRKAERWDGKLPQSITTLGDKQDVMIDLTK